METNLSIAKHVLNLFCLVITWDTNRVCWVAGAAKNGVNINLALF